MRGYIYKDIRLLFWLILLIIGYAFMMFTIVMTDSEAANMRLAYYLITMFPFLIMYGIPVESFRQDNQSGFLSYAAALPGSMRKYVKAKYWETLALGVVAFVFSAFIKLLVGHLTNVKISWYYFLVIFTIMLLLCLVTYPLMFAVGGDRMIVVFMLLTGTILIAALLYGLFGDIHYFVEMDRATLSAKILACKKQLKTGLLLSSVGVDILFILSYFISLAAIKRNS